MLVLMDNLISTTDAHVESLRWVCEALIDASKDDPSVLGPTVRSRLNKLALTYRELSALVKDVADEI